MAQGAIILASLPMCSLMVDLFSREHFSQNYFDMLSCRQSMRLQGTAFDSQFCTIALLFLLYMCMCIYVYMSCMSCNVCIIHL